MVEDIYLFYTMPVNMNISKKHPMLHERMQYAMSQLAEERVIEKIFEEQFQSIFDRIDAKNATVFVIDNPLLPLKSDRKGQRNILNRLFSETKEVYLVPSGGEAVVFQK